MLLLAKYPMLDHYINICKLGTCTVLILHKIVLNVPLLMLHNTNTNSRRDFLTCELCYTFVTHIFGDKSSLS